MFELEGSLFHLFKVLSQVISTKGGDESITVNDMLMLKDETKKCMEEIMDVLLLEAGEVTSKKGLVCE
jgi:hypothetical protein